ncbi:hypothetical protein EUTSA_v10026755mg [Eutrema salsugineum]|uniref:TIR domain-containing protein n=1 Tax=Eutrema salsugineum TaxID=72664 RepID=V4MEX6_EUTSA|nr:hypothetical protein EUTSA_v10026755mg [Eutrema salsugineum]
MDNRPQVFINFRGEDLRLTFVPHLKHHLKESNVNVFTDADAAGEPLKNLFNHIRNSRIVIVIFSISYLESKWCLDELVEIRRCLKSKKLDFVIPIFFKVRASHVKEQSGDFGSKFLALQKKHPRLRIMRWKRALRFVAKQIGLAYAAKESSITELDFIKNIVQVVTILGDRIALKDNNNKTNITPQASTPNYQHGTTRCYSLRCLKIGLIVVINAPSHIMTIEIMLTLCLMKQSPCPCSWLKPLSQVKLAMDLLAIENIRIRNDMNAQFPSRLCVTVSSVVCVLHADQNMIRRIHKNETSIPSN